MRRHVSVLVLAVLLLGGLALLAPPAAGQFLEHRIEVINDTGETVYLRVEADDPWTYADSPGYLSPGESYTVSVPAGTANHRVIYAFAPTGRMVAYKRANLHSPGLLRVPAGNDGAVIPLLRMFRLAD